MIRFFDIFFSLAGLIILSPILILIMIIGLIENGSPLFKQERLGQNKKIFFSMITPFGMILRRTKLDELPQLFNVLKGDMSLVGPRPCLSNQKYLIDERDKRGVFNVKPGITGLAQVSNINMEKPLLLAQIDLKMINNMSLYYYFYYILKTFFRK